MGWVGGCWWLHGRAGGCDATLLSPPAPQPGHSLALPQGSWSLWVAGMGTQRSEPMGLDVAAMEVGVLEQRGCAPQALSIALALAPSLQSRHRAVKSSATAVITNLVSEETEEARNPWLHGVV